MTYDDCLELMEAYTIAVRLERCMNDHAGLLPMARDVCEKLEGFIAELLVTSAIGNADTNTAYVPLTITPKPVEPDPLRGWTYTCTSADALDGKLS